MYGCVSRYISGNHSVAIFIRLRFYIDMIESKIAKAWIKSRDESVALTMTRNISR